MSDFESESETELLVLNERRFNYDSEYFKPGNNRRIHRPRMGSIFNCFCG